MIMETLTRLAWARFRAACRNPLRAQAARLRDVLHAAERTEFGRAHDFARIGRIRDARQLVRAYQAAVPVRNAAAMHDDLAAVYAGDWRRLCPEPPLWFSMTAGSTGNYKYIPVTAAYRREVAGASLIFQGAFDACFPGLRGARTQFLVGSAEGGRSPAGVPQGFASGFNYRHLPRLLRRRFVVPYWVFTLDDPVERAYAAGRILMDEPRLAVLAAISPVNLINLRRALDSHADRLIRDVRDGTLTVNGTAGVPGAWRTAPSPARAERLRASLRDGRFPAPLLFPSLRVLVCWHGGNMGYYLDELESEFWIACTFEFPISASEGVFAIPFRANRAGGVLAVTTHFLEFLPADDAATGAALRADELEVGEDYRIVVTNGGGLHRYDMEDIVRVTDRFRDTPVIEFVSKTQRQVSVSNERLTELDVTEAMLQACRSLDVHFGEFLFVPCSDRRYRVLLDGAGLAARKGASAVDLPRLAAEIERALRDCSKGYDFEREDALLDALEVVVTPPGRLQSYLAERPDALPSAQRKPQHLTTEFDAHERFEVEAAHVA